MFRRHNLTITYLTLFLLTTSTAFAGGSIFGGHKSRTSNPDGVSSIGVHICDSLNCPDVILKKGECGDIENATMKYGVCVCNEGYQVKEEKCEPIPCPTGTSADGLGGHATTLADGTMCYCEEENTIYNGVDCTEERKADNCTSYRDCNRNEYCQFTASSAPECEKSETGSCQDLPPFTSYIASDNKTYLLPSASFGYSLWDMQDICPAKGKTMISLADVGCNIDTMTCSGEFILRDWQGSLVTLITTDLSPAGRSYSTFINNDGSVTEINSSFVPPCVHRTSLCK